MTSYASRAIGRSRNLADSERLRRDRSSNGSLRHRVLHRDDTGHGDETDQVSSVITHSIPAFAILAYGQMRSVLRSSSPAMARSTPGRLTWISALNVK